MTDETTVAETPHEEPVSAPAPAAAPASEPERAPLSARDADIHALVDRWHADLFIGSGADTAFWNRSILAREDLKTKLCNL